MPERKSFFGAASGLRKILLAWLRASSRALFGSRTKKDPGKPGP
jgi:hypothetical protein